MIQKLFTLIILFSFSQLYSQDLGTRLFVGITDGEGSSFHSDWYMKPIKGVQVAGALFYANNLPNEFLSYRFQVQQGNNLTSQSFTYDPDDLPPASSSGAIAGGIDIRVYVMPLAYLPFESVRKHELAIGAGYGWRQYIQGSWGVATDITGDPELSLLQFKNNNGFDPSLHVFYQYRLRPGLAFGVNANAIVIDGGEGFSSIGIQMDFRL